MTNYRFLGPFPFPFVYCSYYNCCYPFSWPLALVHSYLVFILFYVLAAGKISRRVSLVHYPEPSELKERQELQMAKSRKKNQISSSMALTNSSQKTATPSRSTRTATTATPTHSTVQRNSRPINGRAASPHSSEHKSSLSEAGEPSQLRNKRHASPGRSHSGVSSSGQGRSTTTTSSGERSSKKIKEKHRR